MGSRELVPLWVGLREGKALHSIQKSPRLSYAPIPYFLLDGIVNFIYHKCLYNNFDNVIYS